MGVLNKMKPEAVEPDADDQSGEPTEARAAGNVDPFEKVYDTPEEQEAVDRVVAAGGKLLYSDEGSKAILEGLKSGAPEEAIAREAFTLMLSLDQKSKGTIPEDAMMPAAVKLASLIAEMGQKAGVIQTSPNTVPGALQHLVALGIENGIIDPQEIEAMMAEMDPAEMEAMRAEQEQIAQGGQSSMMQKPGMQMAGGDPGKMPPPQMGGV